MFFIDLNLKIDKSNRNSWAETIDWIFNDNKFENYKWKKKGVNKVARYTNKIKKLDYIKKDNFIIKKANEINTTTAKDLNLYIEMNSGNSIARDLLRHIRNGIAHGNASIRNNYLEIKDYKDDKHTQQTAYIWIPLDYLIKMKDIYINIENQKM
ncbi:MAG: hypothetical protein JJE03_00790 [Peptostreptococcaceae bacterium]|nr:hypothetical protein [Peptostreptococcaceae bacterium]